MNTRPTSPRFGSKLRRPLLSAACLGIALFATGAARAGLVLNVPTVSAAAGSTANSFDITLQNTGANDVTIGGFAIEITAGSLGINFTDATTSTASGYIFAGHTSFGPDIVTLTGQTLDASDLYDTINAGATVAANSTVGLAHVTFDVAGNASGAIAVVLTAYPGNSLADAAGNNVPITTLNNGVINISGGGGPAPVPEPATIVPAVFAVLAGLWKVRGFRKRAAVATV